LTFFSYHCRVEGNKTLLFVFFNSHYLILAFCYYEHLLAYYLVQSYMNITELARLLKVTPQELRYYLSQAGFDIGGRAIKINKSVANKILKEWPKIKRKIDKVREEKERVEKAKKERIETHEKVFVPAFISVRDFAALVSSPVNIILAELIKNGIFASLNERIDFETAWLVGSELGFEVIRKEGEDETVTKENKLDDILSKEKTGDMLDRPPVIVVMGHVDHGKTSLLDAIRKTNVIGGEAGGITQHIGAYQVERKNQVITFIDTPGHEAFTAMRSRGAKIADVAILVVAADDGVMPQTVEAYKIIEAAKLPFVVAINKVDKVDANIDKTKQELSGKLNITPTDWGGKTTCVPISAKKGDGITDLLDMILLTAETELENIKANPNADAAGTVIESHLSKGSGPVATILVQNGTLRLGDSLMMGGKDVGKIRNLTTYNEGNVKEVGPATPVQIIGLRAMLNVGDVLEVGEGERVKKKKLRTAADASFNKTSQRDENVGSEKVNLIIKGDLLGSIEAIEESLEKINTKDVSVKVVHRGLGNISDGDIKRAEATGSLILGFNVKTPIAIENMAREKNISIKTYNVIYDLLNDVKTEMRSRIVVTYEREDLGRLKVLAIFRTEKDAQIVGGKVIDGVIETESLIEVMRNKELVGTGKLTNLQAGKQNVNKVETDEECGLHYAGNVVIEVGDVLVFYKNKEVKVIF